jgi:hypothetical protein
MKRNWAFWLRWIFANAIGELVGLGSTFAIGFGLFSGPAEGPGILPAILSAFLMTSSGVIEGAVVGWLQWWALRTAFSMTSRRSWIWATVIGALTAWFLGSMPMAIANLASSGQEQAMQEPETSLIMMMAAAMGLAAGLVLAYPQWRVLRQCTGRAWLWLPANCIAWAVGMPLVFLAVDLASSRASLRLGIAIMAIALAVTGALVGAIHGAVLVYLASQKETRQ